MSQPARMETLERFKQGEIQILVASDVAARGLDIVDMSHVFNFDVPFSPEDYVHRIGRTGRAGKTGHSFTLASPSEGDLVEAIEKLIGTTIPRIEIPASRPPASRRPTAAVAADGRGRGRGGKPRRRWPRGERSRGPRREPREHREPRAEAAEAAPRSRSRRAGAARRSTERTSAARASRRAAASRAPRRSAVPSIAGTP